MFRVLSMLHFQVFTAGLVVVVSGWRVLRLVSEPLVVVFINVEMWCRGVSLDTSLTPDTRSGSQYHTLSPSSKPPPMPMEFRH